MNVRSQMHGGKNFADRFFWDSHWLEIWKTTYVPLWDRMEGAWLWSLFTFWQMAVYKYYTIFES